MTRTVSRSSTFPARTTIEGAANTRKKREPTTRATSAT